MLGPGIAGTIFSCLRGFFLCSILLPIPTFVEAFNVSLVDSCIPQTELIASILCTKA